MIMIRKPLAESRGTKLSLRMGQVRLGFLAAVLFFLVLLMGPVDGLPTERNLLTEDDHEAINRRIQSVEEDVVRLRKALTDRLDEHEDAHKDETFAAQAKINGIIADLRASLENRLSTMEQRQNGFETKSAVLLQNQDLGTSWKARQEQRLEQIAARVAKGEEAQTKMVESLAALQRSVDTIRQQFQAEVAVHETLKKEVQHGSVRVEDLQARSEGFENVLLVLGAFFVVLVVIVGVVMNKDRLVALVNRRQALNDYSRTKREQEDTHPLQEASHVPAPSPPAPRSPQATLEQIRPASSSLPAVPENKWLGSVGQDPGRTEESSPRSSTPVRKREGAQDQEAALPQSIHPDGTAKLKPTLPPSAPERAIPSPLPPLAPAIPECPAQAPPAAKAWDMMVLLKFLTKIAKERKINILPVQPTPTWGAAIRSVKGNVRKENEDAAIAFTQGPYTVVIVGDGMGGLPAGKEAARFATLLAARELVLAIGADGAGTLNGAKVLRTVFEHVAQGFPAAWESEHKARHGGIEGFRTTLIALLATRETVFYGYIGDGGLLVLHADGTEEQLLHPQKAEGGALNVLAASLGPTQQGEPVFGVYKRKSGDTVLLGSDGVFDRIGPTFSKEALRVVFQNGGRLDQAIVKILDDLANDRSNGNFTCDDNMTLGFIADGKAPVLTAGFWNDREPIHTTN